MRFLITYCIKSEFNRLYKRKMWFEASSEIDNCCFKEIGMEKFLRDTEIQKNECIELVHANILKLLDIINKK